jgi:hypothetical protein
VRIVESGEEVVKTCGVAQRQDDIEVQYLVRRKISGGLNLSGAYSLVHMAGKH